MADDVDLLADNRVSFLPPGRARRTLTSHGGNSRAGRALIDDGVLCLGLVRPDHADPAEAAVLDGQGRLDWPIGSISVIADERGPMDFPCHRWQAPAGSWTAAAQMSMERSRRARFTNLAPTAGEFTMVVLFAGLFFFLITPLVVQGVVALATSGDFALPNGRLLEAYGGLLHGHFGAGLRRGAANDLPPDAVMWVLTVIGEVLVLGAFVVVGMWMRNLTGTNSRHGLATSTQAAEALGVPRLRTSAALIRPDLYARAGRRGPGRQQVAGTQQTAERKPEP